MEHHALRNCKQVYLLLDEGSQYLALLSLQDAFGLPLPATLAMDYPTITSISSFLQSKVTPTITEASQPRRSSHRATARTTDLSLPGRSANLAATASRQLARQQQQQAAVAVVGMAMKLPGICASGSFLPGGLHDAIGPVQVNRYDVESWAHMFDGDAVR